MPLPSHRHTKSKKRRRASHFALKKESLRQQDMSALTSVLMEDVLQVAQTLIEEWIIMLRDLYHI